MPTLNRAPNEKEIQKLISIYLKAETDIINEIGRLRSQGLVDYHAVAALERVQEILRKMESDAWEYVPKAIEKMFYVRVPEAQKILEPVEKHQRGYLNASKLTSEQTDIVQRLTQNLMGEITDAAMTVMETVQSAILGRVEPDIYRKVGLEQVAAMQATGRGVAKAALSLRGTLHNMGEESARMETSPLPIARSPTALLDSTAAEYGAQVPPRSSGVKSMATPQKLRVQTYMQRMASQHLTPLGTT